MKLYGSYTSPFVRHCRILLHESNLAWEFVETDGSASATQTPTKKVPFFKDGDLALTDSSSIVKYLREKNGQPFCLTALEYDHFCMVNTMLEASINLFMLAKDGITPDQSKYLQRHTARIQTTLAELNQRTWREDGPYNDVELRLLCYLDWVLLRKLFTFDEYENLTHLLISARHYLPFVKTAPIG